MDRLLPLLAVLMWSGNAVVTKAAAGIIAPAEISFYRWLIAAAVLGLWVARPLLRNLEALRPHLIHLVILGVLGSALFPTLMYVAAQYTTATNLGIIQVLMPLFAIGFASLMGAQSISTAVVIGVLLSLTGGVVVVSRGDFSQLVENGVNSGDLIMLAATACFALYSALVRKWQTGLPAAQDLFIQALSASLVLLPLYVVSDHQGLNSHNLPLVVFAAIPASLVAPWMWIVSIQRIGPERAALFFNLLPFFTVILAALFLGEKLTASLAIGGILTVLGVALAQKDGGFRDSGKKAG